MDQLLVLIVTVRLEDQTAMIEGQAKDAGREIVAIQWPQPT